MLRAALRTLSRDVSIIDGETAELELAFARGGGKDRPAEFHDVVPGTYVACAALFDAATMDMADRPFGCTKVTVVETEAAREVEIALAN